MVIEIPDDVFEFEFRKAFGKMPPTQNRNPDNRKKASPVLYHVGRTLRQSNDIFITMVIIYKAVQKELKKRGIIIYNSDTDKWQGVDYDGD